MTPQDDASERYADGRQRYRLDSRIAVGGMGEVWRATDTLLGRRVAVKLLKSEYADDPTFRSRFATEAQHAAALDHPGVAAVFDVGESGPGDGTDFPRPYLVMELVDGEPLSTLLSEGRQSGRGIDRDVLRDLLAQAATAIGAAHASGIVHRDVKPANLLVTRDRRVKITDFGIARAAHSAGITQTGQVMGTPQYLSPEQARGQAATAASDVYALGVVAFECLAGRRPFEADSPVATALAHLQQPVPDLPDDVPADLAAVVRTALAKDPRDRFPNGAAFAAALRDPATAVLPGGAAAATLVGMGAAGAVGDHTDATRLMTTGAVPADRPSTLETPVSPPAPAKNSGRPLVLLAVIGAMLLVLGVLVGVYLLVGDESGTTPPGGEETSATPPSEPTTEPTTEPTSEPTTSAPPTPTSEPPTTTTTEPTPTQTTPTPTPTSDPTPTDAPTPTTPDPSASATVGETAGGGGGGTPPPPATTTGSVVDPGGGADPDPGADPGAGAGLDQDVAPNVEQNADPGVDPGAAQAAGDPSAVPGAAG